MFEISFYPTRLVNFLRPSGKLKMRPFWAMEQQCVDLWSSLVKVELLSLLVVHSLDWSDHNEVESKSYWFISWEFFRQWKLGYNARKAHFMISPMVVDWFHDEINEQLISWSWQQKWKNFLEFLGLIGTSHVFHRFCITFEFAFFSLMQVTQMTWRCSQTTERGDKLLCTSDCWKRGIASAVDNIGAYKFSFSQLKMLSGVWIVALNSSECLPLYFRLDFVHQKIYRGLLVDMACKKLYVLVVGMLLWRRKKREEKNSNKYKSSHFKIRG